MALEGGYNLDSIANSVLACVEVLLDDKNITRTSKEYPFDSTWRVIQLVHYISLACLSLFNYTWIIFIAGTLQSSCISL